MTAQRKAPARQHRGHSNNQHGQLYRLPADWRERLPDPGAYYATHIERPTKANIVGWMQGRCPFHDDKHDSLSVNAQHGGWRCFAGCGSGDMVSFHQRLSGKRFKAAVRDLIGGANE